jgi:hypothetical protein
MARPIKETPILHGEDAKRFIERMEQSIDRKETVEERDKRLSIYRATMQMFLPNA